MRDKCAHHVIVSLCQDIDDYICQAKDKSYDTLVHYGRKGLNVAATAAVMAASKVMLSLDIFESDFLPECWHCCRS